MMTLYDDFRCSLVLACLSAPVRTGAAAVRFAGTRTIFYRTVGNKEMESLHETNENFAGKRSTRTCQGDLRFVITATLNHDEASAWVGIMRLGDKMYHEAQLCCWH